MARFFSKKVTLPNGDVFDSQTEYEVWLYLLEQQKQDIISNLERQKTFLLQESFKTKDNKTIRKTEYIADFVYTQNNEIHISDAKGSLYNIDPVFKLKWKMLKFIYRDYNYHIIIKDKTKQWVDLENPSEVKAMKEREKAIQKKPKKTPKKKTTK